MIYRILGTNITFYCPLLADEIIKLYTCESIFNNVNTHDSIFPHSSLSIKRFLIVLYIIEIIVLIVYLIITQQE